MTNLDRRARAFATVDHVTELPLLVLAVAMVPLLIAPFVLNLSVEAQRTIIALDWFIWSAFALELVTKTYLAPQRRRYLTTHWIDVVIVVVPFLRPLRVVRSARALRLLRLTRVAAITVRGAETLRVILSRHGLQYVLLGGIAFVVGSAILVLLLERGGDGSINDAGTAIWWALATVTTVGYGDAVPVSGPGRAIGVLLMFVGIGVFGVLTANVAAFFVESDPGAVTNEQLLEELRELRERIDER